MNFKRIPKASMLSFLIISSFYGCKKQEPEKQFPAVDKKLSVANALTAGLPTPGLDWENISFMPVPANSPQIPVPWQGGLGGAKIDDDMIFDYHSANGWELVYNTFSTATKYEPAYFMLYNKYRGVLRTYFYIAPGGNYPSSNIAHFLNLRGIKATTSPLLNFSSKEFIDFNSYSQSVSQIQPYQVSASGSWYAAEFELAYDPAVGMASYDQLRLDWLINPNSVTNITLNGTQTGEISGTITSETPGSNFFSGIANGILDGGLKLGADSANNAKALKFIPALIKGPIVAATKNALGGIIKGFLSGILGGTSSTSTQKVSLKINTKINITGQAVTSSQLFSNIFSVPGTSGITNVVPFYPKYQDALGVFYISGKPKVKQTVVSELVPGGFREYRTYQNFNVNENSFQLIINPKVSSIANITNIKKDAIIMNILENTTVTSIGGIEELVADKKIYSGSPSIWSQGPRPHTIGCDVAVRVSFDVVPKDGSPKCTIVKTFLATRE